MDIAFFLMEECDRGILLLLTHFGRDICFQTRVIYSLLLVLHRSLYPNNSDKNLRWHGMARRLNSLSPQPKWSQIITMWHKKYFSDTIQNCEAIILSPLFRFSFRRATILFLKMVLLHLLLISSKSSVEFYLEIVWLMLMTALAWDVSYETSKLSRTLCCFLLSSQK